MKEISEINLTLKTIEVKGGQTIKMTVRNMFYVGFIGKLKTFYFWLSLHRDKTFKEYLDSPVKYVVDMGELNSFHSIDAEDELTELLKNEIDE